MLTPAVVAAATGRTRPAVAHAIAQLERAGIVSALTGSPHNRAWEAGELLDLVVALEAGRA